MSKKVNNKEVASEKLTIAIMHIMKELLGVDQLKSDDNFFYLGGSSLTAVELNHQVEKHFNISAPIEHYFHGNSALNLTEILIQLVNDYDDLVSRIEQFLAEEVHVDLKQETVTDDKNEEDAKKQIVSNSWQSYMPDLNSLTSNHKTKDSTTNKLDFSIFFFSGSDKQCDAKNKYQFIFDAATYADDNNFCAIWVPERHFHEFGGLHPNPAVLHSALAAKTKQIKLRAGSVVLPLNHIIRVAENWSIVDNISGGRVGLSIAPGFHPNDFVLAPQNYSSRREIMEQSIPLLKQLWSCEPLDAVNGKSDKIDVTIHPFPVQKELPLWLTASRSSDSFLAAGKQGFNILTGLMEQSIELLETNIKLYKEAFVEHHPNKVPHVTLMIHTYVGTNIEEIRKTVEAPFCNYLKSHMNFAKAFATKRKNDLINQSQDKLVQLAFEKYFTQNSLIGTVEECIKRVNHLSSIGVDEVGCLIDFGVDTVKVINSLQYLNEVKNKINDNSLLSDVTAVL